VLFCVLLQRPVFRRVELLFMLFLGGLSVSLLTAAAWSRPDLGGILRGTLGFQLPARTGTFDASLVAVSLVGAVAGSLANLMYPYFIREKGWTTPAHRRVQAYDLALGIVVIIVLDLAVWVLGAEVVRPAGVKIDTVHDLAHLLRQVMGRPGAVLIYAGVFAAVASTIVGNALAYGYMATDAFLLWRPPRTEQSADAQRDYRRHPGYRRTVLWVLFSPIFWVVLNDLLRHGGAGGTSFVALTVAINAFQVLLLPVLAAAMWALTSGTRFIGREHRNRWWENLGMAVFTAMALLGAVGSVQSLARML
jgi:Mn2+/Fe2+ NRAMP family transporter